MSEWKVKRFWSGVTVEPLEGGYCIKLDDRTLQTPNLVPLVVPTEAIASAIAKEWEGQEEDIDPTTMPLTRIANFAIDNVALRRAEIVDALAAYGDSDLLCYRAEFPEALVDRQNAEWDPLLDWANETLGARMKRFPGIVHQPQSSKDLAQLSRRVRDLGIFELAAFHDLVSISGSLIIGIATQSGFMDAETLWEISRIDERWQEEQWGFDEEAHKSSRQKRLDFTHAAMFLSLCSGTR